MNDYETANMLFERQEYFVAAYYYELWLNNLYSKVSAKISNQNSILNNSIAIERIDDKELLKIISIRNTSFITPHYRSFRKPVEVCEEFVLSTCDKIQSIYKSLEGSAYEYLLEQ